MEERKIDSRNFIKEIEKLKNFRLITISVIDSKKNYELLYHFDIGKIKTIKILIPENQPIISSIVHIFPSAEFYEREIHDFFGIEFKGNPKLHEKMFLPDDWIESPPLKKNRGE